MATPLHSIGEIAEQIRGVTYRKQDASATKRDGYLPILRAGNITDFGLTYEDLVYVPSSKISPRQMVKENDILIAASSGSIEVVGKAARALQDFSGGFGGFCKILRLKAQVDAAYFSHFFKTPEYRRKVSSLAAGANINNLKNEHLDSLKIPLPPLAEQKRIAAILDAADELRAKRREAITQLDVFLQSTFIEMFGDPVSNPFGWDRLAFGEVIASGPQNGIYKPSMLYGSGTKILRIDSFYNGQEVVLDGLKRVEVSEQEINSYSLSESDIVINRVNSRSHLGKCTLMPAMEEPVLFESNMMRLHLDNKQVLPRFMVRFLQTQYVKNQILSACKDAVNQSSINQTDIKSFQVLVPPLELQGSFATIVESVEQQKTKMRAHLAELDALFASLQHRAFNGEL